MYVITADSSPVYGRIYDFWSADDWVLWHSLNVKEYGRDAANEKLIKAWNDSPFFAANISFRTFSAKFIQYAKDNEFYDALFDGFLGAIGQAESTVGQVATAGTKTIQNAASALTKISDTVNAMAFLIVPLLLIAGSYFLYWKFLRSRKRA